MIAVLGPGLLGMSLEIFVQLHILYQSTLLGCDDTSIRPVGLHMNVSGAGDISQTVVLFYAKLLTD